MIRINGGITGAIPYIMSNIDSADIDNEIDFMFAAAFIKSKKQSIGY